MFELPEEHRMLQELVAKFVDRDLIPLEKATLAREMAGQPAGLTRGRCRPGGRCRSWSGSARFAGPGWSWAGPFRSDRTRGAACGRPPLPRTRCRVGLESCVLGRPCRWRLV